MEFGRRDSNYRFNFRDATINTRLLCFFNKIIVYRLNTLQTVTDLTRH